MKDPHHIQSAVISGLTSPGHLLSTCVLSWPGYSVFNYYRVVHIMNSGVYDYHHRVAKVIDVWYC